MDRGPLSLCGVLVLCWVRVLKRRVSTAAAAESESEQRARVASQCGSIFPFSFRPRPPRSPRGARPSPPARTAQSASEHCPRPQLTHTAPRGAWPPLSRCEDTPPTRPRETRRSRTSSSASGNDTRPPTAPTMPLIPERLAARSETRAALDAQFWEQGVASARTLDGTARTAPADPPPLGLLTPQGASRPQQLLIIQAGVGPVAPGYDFSNGGAVRVEGRREREREDGWMDRGGWLHSKPHVSSLSLLSLVRRPRPGLRGRPPLVGRPVRAGPRAAAGASPPRGRASECRSE